MNEETIVGRITPNREFALRAFKRIQDMTKTYDVPWRVMREKEGVREIYLGNNINLTLVEEELGVRVLNETETEMTCNRISKEEILNFEPAQIAENLFRMNRSSIDYKETAKRIVKEFPSLEKDQKTLESALRTRTCKGLMGWRSLIFFHTFTFLNIENDSEEGWKNPLNDEETARSFLSRVMVLDYSVSEWSIAYALKSIFCPDYADKFLAEQDYIIQATDEEND